MSKSNEKFLAFFGMVAYDPFIEIALGYAISVAVVKWPGGLVVRRAIETSAGTGDNRNGRRTNQLPAFFLPPLGGRVDRGRLERPT